MLEVTRERLGRPDMEDAIPSEDEQRLKAIADEIGTRQADIKRARHDYRGRHISGFEYRVIKDGKETAIAVLEAERRSLTATTDLGGVLDAEDPGAAFDDADLMIKRRIIDDFMEVRLYPHPRGRKTFDPTTVKVTPKKSSSKGPMTALPEPECAHGYTEAQIKALVGDDITGFDRWRELKAHPTCTGAAPCRQAHGDVVYRFDLEQFRDRRR